MWLTRSIGVNLHPTSLPGGRLGPEAYAFVDWLAAAGARFWQVLPLGPPDEFGSPYTSTSAFAAWAGLLADPDAAVAPSELHRFEVENAYWIGDWVDFAGRDALAEQVRFQREWSALRDYAAQRGVLLIGDVPIYVAEGSCDHLAHPELFVPVELTVAGAPPDPLNGNGQRWGNPLYDWDALARQGYRWWIERMRRMLRLVDVFRIDHFRGFAGYWTVPAASPTARDGYWTPGPGAAVFHAAEHALGKLPVIAEDLGVITPDVHALREGLGFPGMAILVLGVSGASRQPTPAREPPCPRGGLHIDPRHRHAGGSLPRRFGVGSDRRGPLVAGSARRDARAGCARARLGGEDESARCGRGELGLAASARSARAARSPGGCAPPRRRRRVHDDVGGARPQSIGSTGSFAATTLRPSRS